MENLLTEWWPFIVPLLPLVAKLLNKITPKWDSYGPRILRVLGLLLEIGDVFRNPSAYKKGIKKSTPLELRIRKVLNGHNLY